MEGITVHCMIRNEPFVYYAVNSVYPWVEKILLYDTGSYDKYTLSDIQRLLDEDKWDKITFKKVPIEVDETKWTCSGWLKFAKQNEGKKGKWYCRQLQIKDTQTKFFMILDGDEVYYEDGMKAIVSCSDNWPRTKLAAFQPLIWFKDLKHTFASTQSGRLFLTERTWVTSRSPGELHIDNKTKKRIGPKSDVSFTIPNAVPFAHFETMLKPWRRTPKDIKLFEGQLPEVMVRDMSLVKRFQNEVLNK